MGRGLRERLTNTFLRDYVQYCILLMLARGLRCDVNRCNKKKTPNVNRWHLKTIFFSLHLFWRDVFFRRCLVFKSPSGLQAFMPCVTSQDIPHRNFLDLMTRPSSLSATHTSFLCACVYVGIPTSWVPRMPLLCTETASHYMTHLKRQAVR